MAELEIWLREQRAKLSSKSETAKAIHYSLKRWSAFTRFLEDGRLCISNNAAERALRGIAVGRHNWTFAGSDEGGGRAAAIYTLVETAKLDNIDPQLGSPTFLPGCRIIQPGASTNCCPGIGVRRTSPLKRPEPAVAPEHPVVFTGCVRSNTIPRIF